MAFHKSYGNFGTPISLRVVLWGVLLQGLLETLDTEIPKRLGQELDNRRLIVALKGKLRVTKPLDIVNKCTHRETFLVHAFRRHNVSKHALTTAITDNQHLHSGLARLLEII